MKKLPASIALLIYFTVSTGSAVSIHYCINKVDNVECGDSNGIECDKCGMHIKKGNSCSKDDVKLVKMKTERPVAKMIVADFSLSLLHSIPTRFIITSFRNCSPAEYFIAQSPPLIEPPNYRNHVFRL